MRRVSGRAVFSALLAAALVALAVGVAGAADAPKLMPGTVNSAGEFAPGNNTTQGTEELSANGNLFVFNSKADNLPGGDGSTLRSYLHNFKTGKTKLVSKDAIGNPSLGEATFPEISPDG